MGRRPVLSPLLPLALVALLAGLAACGPIAYVNEVTRRADNQIEAARRAEADKLAPYWWTRAIEYRYKARERAAHADFQGANRFGKLAGDAAEQAIVDASDPSKRPIDAFGTGGGTGSGSGSGMAPAKGGDDVAPAKDGEAPAQAPAKDGEAPAPAKDGAGPAPAKGGAVAPAKGAP